MIILAVDDEAPARRMLEQAIAQACPDSEIHSFESMKDTLAFARENACDIAFLDINLRGDSGLDLAKKLKDSHPRLNVVFVTGYAQYMGDAFAMHVSGYILKPVTKEAIEREITNLRFPVGRENKCALLVRTFGRFEVFAGGKPLPFSRTKTKELFAYLINRCGAECDYEELVRALWPERGYDRAAQSNLRNLISDLSKTLRGVGADKVIHKRRGRLSVLTDKIDCDYYDFCRGDAGAVNRYAGVFMQQYSWAEFTNVNLW